ncbi:PQQ-dependent sugar dehydrogenase [Methanoculleus horonobensis]|uniref:PQQ-dependent sugar dehydrogenase n=1 Tax=Methanoculleus horonobensis TaxID=528314 RepID=UPI000B08285A|nr:PQQ-dependent sugar dehydrogenase [Methanoculleus horonobensis]
MTRAAVVMISFLVLLALAGVAGAAVYPNGGTDLTQAPAPEAVNLTATTGNLTNAGSLYAAEYLNNTSTTRLAGEALDVSLEPVADGLVAPLMLTDAGDDSGRLFVVDQVGTVSIIDPNGTLVEEPFLDVRDRMVNLTPSYDERGLLSIAFHPGFGENGRVFAFYSAPLREGAPDDWDCTNRLSEFQVDAENPDRVNMTSEKVLLEIDKPQFNHNGGSIAFGPRDGYLYVPLGDGGAANDNGTGHTPEIGNAQNLTNIYGNVLRIDVDNVTAENVTEVPENATWTTAAGTLYGIPADNPFVGNASIPPEIYAYGFRNPAFITFDAEGNLFAADAGQNLFEEVSLVVNGGNYGWRLMEGTHCFDPENPTMPPATCPANGSSGEPLIGPVIEGGRDLGVVFVGGRVYNGTALPELAGRYVFGYWSTGFDVANATLLAATPPAEWNASAIPDSAENLTPEEIAMWSLQRLNVTGTPAGTLDVYLLGFGEDADAELYALTSEEGGPDAANATGRVWKVVPANVTETPAPTANVTMVPGAGVTATPTATENVTITPTANVTTVPTANATTTPAANATPTPAAPGTQDVTVGVAAEAFAFNTSTIPVPAGANVTMVFYNQDTGIPHNVAVYTDSSAAEAIFVGDIITGPDQVTYTFTAPEEPGTYYFRCDVHPPMDGEFVVE